MVPKFEQLFSQFTEAKHSYAVNSATSALHIACLALGVGPGDNVWTSANSFVASANCAIYCSANIDFVDIDPFTLNISLVSLEEKLKDAKSKGLLPKVLVVVHFSGASVDMRAIQQLSKKYGFAVIEDASHAVGAKYDGDQVGSCKFSDIAVFSFHPVKIITTGEGGMVTTNSDLLGERINLSRSHGITKLSENFIMQAEGPWSYEQQLLGFNYRMSDLQAALGISQLKRLNDFLQYRKLLARRYETLLEDVALLEQYRDIDNSANHLFVIQLEEAERRLEIFNYMRSKGIGVNVHYIPIYRQPFYQKKGFKKENFPNTENYYRRCITLPIFYDMGLSEQDYVLKVLLESMKNECR